MNRISNTILVIVLVALAGAPCFAVPSKGFKEFAGEKFDDWKVCRTRTYSGNGFLQYQPSGEDFRPALAFESLGENKDIAYRLGADLAVKFPDKMQCAERIFVYVRDHVDYMTDQDNYGVGEFGVNADESALAIQARGNHKGDCEDMAFLLAVMYQGAGIRSAIVALPGHLAVMIHLPGYSKATMDWSINGEPGWIWAEATGRQNFLGWTPEQYIRSEKMFYELSAEAEIMEWPPFEKTIHVEEQLRWYDSLWKLVKVTVALAVVFAILFSFVSSKLGITKK